MAEFDSKVAEEHPLIRGFVRLVEKTASDGLISFTDLETEPFMKFWRNLTIFEYLDDENEFISRFCGTQVTEFFGRDQTGKRLKELGFGEKEDTDIRQMHLDALNGKKPVYVSSSFFYQDREYKKWHQVKMPLKRGDSVKETLGCVVFQ
ncbi:MAG: hypothetical protein ACE5GT_06810 [Rhodospirillales bacterium]